MDPRGDGGSSFPNAAVGMPRLAEVLDRTTRSCNGSVRLLGLDGSVIVQLDRGRSGIDGGSATYRARRPVTARGQVVAEVEVHGAEPDRDDIERSAEDAALQMSDTWNAAQEIDSLASEIIHSYEELHLLYELGESLAEQISVARAVDLIMDRLQEAIPARRIEICLDDDSCFSRSGAEVSSSESEAAPQRLVTLLRSGGKVMGTVGLTRADEDPAFTSVESKLLDGVGAIAASALHNARLYEQLIRQATALAEREENLTAVMDNVAEGIVTVDARGRVASFNPAAEKVFGYSPTEVLGQPFLLLAPEIDPDQGDAALTLRERLARRAAHSPQFETVGRRKDGGSFPMEVTISQMQANGQQMLIVSARDITERRRWEEVLEHRAHHDALTDLPNRSLLSIHLSDKIRSAAQSGASLALLLLDLDHFKDVNDTLGHQTGDRLLQEIGRRLQGAIPKGAMIARLGGDEFALVLAEADAPGAAEVALEILQALDRPLIVDGHSLVASASIGIALFPDHGHDVDALLKHGDVAMYEAKRGQHGYRFYAAERDKHSPGRLELRGELRLAIEQDELVLHYQPQIDLRSGLVTRVEALLRWQHPKRGLMMPAQFVSLAEQVGMIDGLSKWVLDAALRQIRLWLDDGREMSVAVNLSAQNLRDSHLPETVARLLNERGVPPSLLKIEITESSLMADPLSALRILSRLSAMGVQIGIDDFGTGYSSLAYLKRLPVDEIKIDKSFVMQMANDDNDHAIVRSTIGLGHDLGLVVVAEGVEDKHTQELLSRLGCDLAQGYFVGRPVPPGDLVRLLQALQEHRPTDEVIRIARQGVEIGPILTAL